MNIIFKYIFERLTDPLGLPISILYEYAILFAIGFMAYIASYAIIGDLYHAGSISGKTEGSLFHWIIRAFLFAVMWFAVYMIIKGYFFIKANWQIIFIVILSIVGIVTLCIFAVATMRFIKRHRTQ